MFDKILGFLGSLNNEESAAEQAMFDPDDIRLCAAALMYHVIRADGVLRDVEKERLEELVAHQNDAEDVRLGELMKAAKAADSDAVDLYKFTSVLRMKMQMEDRVNFIELLWELVYADGVRHELEDNVVWRISELMGVDSHDRIAMRQRVKARMEL